MYNEDYIFDSLLERRKDFIKFVKEYIKDKEYKNFISIGCGCAAEESCFVDDFENIYLVDFNSTSLDFAKKKYEELKKDKKYINFICDKWENINKDIKYDFIYISGISDWVYDEGIKNNKNLFPKRYYDFIKERLNLNGIAIVRLWGGYFLLKEGGIYNLMKSYMEKEFRKMNKKGHRKIFWKIEKCIYEDGDKCLIILEKK